MLTPPLAVPGTVRGQGTAGRRQHDPRARRRPIRAIQAASTTQMWPPRPFPAAILCLAIAGCASLPSPPRPPERLVSVARGLSVDPAPPFTLRPGDAVLVEAQTEPGRVSWRTTLDAEGKAHLAGSNVLLGGLTVSEAEARVEEKLRERDRFGTVALYVTQTDGQRATVLGAVAHQGSLPVTPHMRVSELIEDSGGVLSVLDSATGAPISLADLEGAILTRDGRALPIDVARAMQGDPYHNVFVHPGDHLFVPRREPGSVSIFGQVGAPGVFACQSGMRMTEALARAGGITTAGDKSDIRLLRGPVEAPAVFRADLAAIVDGAAPDVALQPGDVLFVTDDPLEDVGEVLRLLLPLATISTGTFLLALVLASQ